VRKSRREVLKAIQKENSLRGRVLRGALRSERFGLLVDYDAGLEENLYFGMNTTCAATRIF
jgi:hypothetical protein